jgi:hypothetical protein
VPRTPTRPARDAVPADERADYDFIVDRFRTVELDETTTVEDEFDALLVSPPLAAALSRFGKTFMKLGGRSGTWSFADHEFIDCVLALDLGYRGFLAFHAPQAVAEGVRPAALQALRAGDLDRLTDDERLCVAFIRAAAHGTMSDELWARMCDRLGSERGAVEYTFFVLFLQLHIRLHQALDIPQFTEEQMDQLLADLAAGTHPLPASVATGAYATYSDYASKD